MCATSLNHKATSLPLWLPYIDVRCEKVVTGRNFGKGIVNTVDINGGVR